MYRLSAGARPAGAAKRNPGTAVSALGISLSLHGAAIAGFVFFWEPKPPELFAVIAVELVEAGDIAGSPGKDIGAQSPLPISMERKSTETAGRTPDLRQLAKNRDQDDKLNAVEAVYENDSSSAERTTKPIQFSAPAPMSEDTSDAREAVPPIPPEPLPFSEDAIAIETMRRIPPTPSRKPLAPNPSTDAKSTRSQFEDKLMEMTDDTRQPTDRTLAREIAQFGADRTAAQTQRTATLALEKGHDLAIAPTRMRTNGLGESAGTLPRYSGRSLSNTAPRYPYIARRRGQEGRVILRVQVSARGDPASIRVQQSSGYRRLDDAAVEAVKTWRFAPARRGGVSVAGSVDVPVSFKLTDQ